MTSRLSQPRRYHAKIVTLSKEKIAKTAVLQQQDIKMLYDGIRHYDPLMDPAEILYKWMDGFVPLPACGYEDEACTKLVDSDETVFCSRHQCHFMVVDDQAQLDHHRCESPVVLDCGYCTEHLCTSDWCESPVFRDHACYCEDHACFVCIRDSLPVREAVDEPPRNSCADHPLCYATTDGLPCGNLVSVEDPSFCLEHARPVCHGVTRSGKACTSIAMSRSTPYCHSHRAFAEEERKRRESKSALDAGKCHATNAKGKPCGGKPLAGKMFCANHIGKSVPPQSPAPQVNDAGRADSWAKTETTVAGASSNKRDDGSEAAHPPSSTPDIGALPTDHCSAQVLEASAGEAEATSKDEGDEKDDDDAASWNSDEFVDCALDSAPPNNEDDYDEPDHIQHLRDVDEVEPGAVDDNEFAFEEDEAVADGDPGGVDGGAHDGGELAVSEWHWDMTLEHRWQAIRALLRQWDPIAHRILRAIHFTFNQTRRALFDEQKRARTKMYEGRAVIGGTITGCVTRLEAIRATKPFAILVEEASEVLEPLLFACLGSTTCKLEMIGDHLQLQPSVNSKFDFERINKINISMFERLIRAPAGHEVPSSVLSIQRRMRKNIADLTREFYAEITTIEDHAVCLTKTIQSNTLVAIPRTASFGGVSVSPVDKIKLAVSRGREVLGVAPHLFFWTHHGREERARVGLSKINTREADMVCHLAKYLTECGVPSKSIAILTPYKGQLMLMRQQLTSKQFGMGRLGRDKRYEPTCTLSTVDRFQGDEADVVIVSLVIDGKSKTPFVKLQNRMIVLLSRARIGMYVVGNTEYFTNAAGSAPSHWQATLDKLHAPAPSDNTPAVEGVWPAFDQARLGDKLPLCCPMHRESVRYVRDPRELKLTFCPVVCHKSLSCTHECGKRCHWATLDQHTATCKVLVDSPCSRHPRQLACAQVCQSTTRLTIQDALATYRCDEQVELQLPCTHIQKLTCAQEVDVLEKKVGWPLCTEKALTPFVYPDCKHERACSCVDYHAFQPGGGRAAPPCTQTVVYEPLCGHSTTLKCYLREDFNNARNKYVCTKSVKVVLPRCSHDATLPCSLIVPLRSWSGTALSSFGVVEEGAQYGPTDHTCSKMVTFRRGCGHEASVQCSVAFTMASTRPPCPENVVFVNPECGHLYQTTCADAVRLQQRVAQFGNVSSPLTSPVQTVQEDDLASSFRSFGLGVACHAKVTLQRACGHEQELSCHQVRSSSQPCGETVCVKRPDCGHDCVLPCSLTRELRSWAPWSHVPTENDHAVVQQLLSSGVLSTALPAPTAASSPAILSHLKPCKQSILLRRDATCGHEVRMPCEQAVNTLRGEVAAPMCRTPTTKQLACGHSVEVACHLDVSSYRCKESVAKPCWNGAACHQTVQTQCAAGDTGLLRCESRIPWTCPAGKHEFHVAICAKGEPVACPSCSYETLEDAIKSVQSICDAGARVPWPPAALPATALALPAFAKATKLSTDDKLAFYSRQLTVLERFRGWVEQDEDVWSRALFQPVYLPVFTVVEPTKKNVKQPVTRFEVKDFASLSTWNNVQAFPLTSENLPQMIPAAGGGGGGGGKKSKAPTSRRVVFSVLFSLSVNANPSDAPPPLSRTTPRHTRWIDKQQQDLGFDCAFFATKRGGAMAVDGGLLRVWEPFTMFPTAEATVRASDRPSVLASLAGELGETLKTTLRVPTTRFLAFQSLEASSPSTGGTSASGVSRLSLSASQEQACHQLLEALPFRWAHGIRLWYPWSGKQLLVGSSSSLPESVEQDLYDKVSFMRGHGSAFSKGVNKKKKAPAGGPFGGLNLLQKISAKQPFAEIDLFDALELLEVRKQDTSAATDKLESYVSRIHQQNGSCHPLVLLALARVIARDPDISPRVRPAQCLALFQELYPEGAELWLTPVEKTTLLASTVSGSKTQAAMASDESAMTVEERWQKLKSDQNVSSEAMEELLKMVGLARVKRFAINMFKSALAFQRMAASQRKKNAMAMNYCFVGNPGTGKTTVAKLFARILHDSKMRRASTAELCNAQELKDKGAKEFRDTIQKAMGGVVFIDEAYELEPISDPKGKPIVAELLVAAEEHRHDLSMILAGYEDDIQQKLYAYNDGIRSRFTEVLFEDFDECDLRVIWDGLLTEREWTCDPKVGTIACRRLARGAGRKGFGNARAVRQLFEQATAEAMAREDFDGVTEIRAADVIGERPSKNPKLRTLLHELDGKIGWKRIKQRVKEIIDVCDANYQRELNGQETLSIVMNRLFLGNPGTGKTTCAKLYGKLLKHLGFLSTGDVVAKTAGDFVGAHVGQSQTKTNEILTQAKGKVLIIDEAYNLDDNLYGKQVLDVLVEKVQGSDNDDIAVILIGYEQQMQEMLRTQNPGLARRFPIEYAFFFDDYDDHELYDMFSAVCARKNVYCPLDVEQEVVKLLAMQCRQANFGNAGAVEMLVKNAMVNASKRPLVPGETKMRLQLEDLENEMAKRAKDEDDDGGGNDNTETKEPEDPLSLLDKLYRMDDIKDELQRLRARIQVAEDEGEERPEIGHFLFRGSPGTGKTTVARAMGKILHQMGLLGSDRVVETSGLNLTGEYVGQTKKKVEEQLGQARGAVLFVDEAYELGKGLYGEEAMTTLVAAMTDPLYDGMVIILAGYPADMDAMLDRNAGLKSRFTRFLNFPDWEASDCVAFMQSRSTREKYLLAEETREELYALFETMRTLPGFGNARDVDKVWKSVLECRAQRVAGDPELTRTITCADVDAASERVIAARRPPDATPLCRSEATHPQERVRVQGAAPQELPRVEELQKEMESEEPAMESEEPAEPDHKETTHQDAGRDPDVSDEVWEELERAKQAYEQLLRDLHDQEERKKRQEEELKAFLQQEHDRQLREEALRNAALQAERERKQREEAQRKVQVYQATQEKLRRLAKCPAGFEWRQVGGGWRCGGGSHYVSNAELERSFMH